MEYSTDTRSIRLGWNPYNMAEIEGQTGSDPTDEIISALETEKKRLSRDAAAFWFEKSQNRLEQAASTRADIDDTRDARGSLEGRAKNGLYAIQQGAVPPAWDDDEEHWSFSYPHEGAVFQEFGARPHEIRAKKAEVLAFEWPDAPQEIKEEFSHTEGDLVFFESISHPGIPAIGFVRYGRDQTVEKLNTRGIDTEEFGGDGA